MSLARAMRSLSSFTAFEANAGSSEASLAANLDIRFLAAGDSSTGRGDREEGDELDASSVFTFSVESSGVAINSDAFVKPELNKDSDLASGASESEEEIWLLLSKSGAYKLSFSVSFLIWLVRKLMFRR